MFLIYYNLNIFFRSRFRKDIQKNTIKHVTMRVLRELMAM